MKKNREASNELRPEYDESLIRSGVRGKYVEQYRASKNVVVLAPDVAAAFPDADAVNDALRLLLKVAKESQIKGRRRSG